MLQGRLLGGRYRVAKQLGMGGMGVVYSAMQEDLKRMVALKVLLDPSLMSTRDLARFRQEALSAAELRHPNIVQVTDFQTPRGEPPFIVMELLTGESLQSLLAREPVLPQARAVFIATQILAALAAAHAAGIVHRDIKPGNVFLTATPALADLVKVLDFGIAKVLRARDDAPRSVVGAVTGTPAYMAPEQAFGQEVDARADVYAVGACLFEMLTGRPPYLGRTAAELLSAIKSREAPPQLRALAPSVDAHVAEVVDRALAKDRSHRPATSLDMLRALAPERALAAAAAMPPPTSAGPNETGAALHFSGGEATQRTPPEPGNATLAPLTRTQGSPGAVAPPTMTLSSPVPRAPLRPDTQPPLTRTSPPLLVAPPRAGAPTQGASPHPSAPMEAPVPRRSPLRAIAIASLSVLALLGVAAAVVVVVVVLRARQAVARYSPAPSTSFSVLAQTASPTRIFMPSTQPSPGALVGDPTEDFAGLAVLSRITWSGNVPTGTSETVPVVFDGATMSVAWQGRPIDGTAFPQAVTALHGKVLVKTGDHTVVVYDGATGNVQASVETPRPVQQICAPESGRSAWVELMNGDAGVIDVDAPSYAPANETPRGCRHAGRVRTAFFPLHARAESRTVNGRLLAVLVNDGLEVSVQTADNADDLLIARDTAAAQELWRRQEPRSQASPRVVDLLGGRAFIQDSAWLEEIDARTGKAHWRVTLPPNRGATAVTLSSSRVYVSTVATGVYVVDENTGAVAGHVLTF